MAASMLFSDMGRFRVGFEHGLEDMLEHDVLGAFILVLANASFEQETFERLKQPLRSVFERWERRFALADEMARRSAPDDVAVFQRLQQHGFDHLQTTRWRQLDAWELQFNQLRAFRPPRMSDTRVTSLYRAFDPQGFNFNKPFLRKEILWEGELLGAPVRLLYNKFPFAELHGLLVPDPAREKPQFLARSDHDLIWEIGEQLGRRLPGLGFGYNAYGAYSSVNHLHFQMFVRTAGRYPLQSEQWKHNGGMTSYPLRVRTFVDRRAAWAAVECCQHDEFAFNLLYRPGILYLVERALQGSYRHSDWTSGFAWSEVAGAVTLFDEEVFTQLTNEQLLAEFAKMQLRP